MKGVIFNLFERVVSDEVGTQVWSQIVDGSGVRSAYDDDGTYSHEELLDLVRETAIALSKTTDETLVWFGRRSIPLLAGLFPTLFAGPTSTVPFVMSLNGTVHPEVRRRFPDAYVPTFDMEQAATNTLIIGYSSYRDLCRFAEGMLLGTADLFGEDATVEHFHCQRNGDPRCVMLLHVLSPDRPT